jgi:hypothetical protein
MLLVATRHKGPLKDGKDLVGGKCFNLEPEELLSMCFVCIMNEGALRRLQWCTSGCQSL